jgi:hypothetical protein
VEKQIKKYRVVLTNETIFRIINIEALNFQEAYKLTKNMISKNNLKIIEICEIDKLQILNLDILNLTYK